MTVGKVLVETTCIEFDWFAVVLNKYLLKARFTRLHQQIDSMKEMLSDSQALLTETEHKLKHECEQRQKASVRCSALEEDLV
jgi:hypothetical protein